MNFKEVHKLGELLTATLDQIDRVARLYLYLDQLDGIERVELQKLITLCENAGDILSLARFVEYVQKPRKEGQIFLQDNGRYLMTTTGIEFTCGWPIEVFIDGQGWQMGNVEHSEKYGGYYFYNFTGEENCRLHDGMQVAVRI